jgi:hypothetical protein
VKPAYLWISFVSLKFLLLNAIDWVAGDSFL